MQEPSESGTRKAVPPSQHDLKDKGKAKMIEPEKPLNKKDHIKFDEEVAKRLAEELEAELEEEERVTIQREEEANLILWDNNQAMMEADYELAQRLQAEEHGELTIEERSRLFVELMDKRKKHFAKLRAKKIKRKPPTKAQIGIKMSTYLRNHADTITLSEELKIIKKFNVNINLFKKYQEYDEAINVESLSTKYPIVDWKTHILAEDKMYYQIIRADGSEKYYKIFSAMLDDFDRQDVLDLYRLVKERFETSSPEGYDRLLWGDLITLFKLNNTADCSKGRSRDPHPLKKNLSTCCCNAQEETQERKSESPLQRGKTATSIHIWNSFLINASHQYSDVNSTEVSEQKGTTKGTRTNTMFTKQSILGKPPFSLSSGSKLNFVTPFPKSSVLPKVDKKNALSKPVTSNSEPSTQESKVMIK
ncbi:hypothetical protein Tco_1533685 [Tanacetum coccineum]